MPVWSNDDWLTCLKEKELIINLDLVTYSILATELKWRAANGVVNTFAKMCVKSIFFRLLLIKQVTLSNLYKFPML